MRFHADLGWMVHDRDRESTRTYKWQLIHIDIDREIHFAIGSLYVADQELGLEIEELHIAWNSSGSHLQRM